MSERTNVSVSKICRGTKSALSKCHHMDVPVGTLCWCPLEHGPQQSARAVNAATSASARHDTDAGKKRDPGFHFSFTISSYLGGGSRYDGVSSPLLSRCPATSSYDGGGVAPDNQEATESESGT